MPEIRSIGVIELREPHISSPPRLVAMKNAGLLGRKSGRGFYAYD